MSSGRPTLGDVAREAGVHKATASRALNPDTAARVNPETAARVKAAADRIGYRPNVYARGLRTRNTHTVGVIVADIVNPLYPPIVRGVEDGLGVRGFSALIVNTDFDGDREQTAIDALLGRQVEGIIAGASETARLMCLDLAEKGTPIVLLDDTRDLPGVSGIATDFDGGMDALVDHLVELGHTRIGHVAGPDVVGEPSRRAQTFLAAVERHQLDDSCCPVAAMRDFTPAAGRVAADRLLDSDAHPTAIVAYNDLAAVGAMRAVTARGLRCPDDISITGFNDLPLVGDLTPPLTTVRLDTRQLGYAAAGLLLSLLDGTSGPVRQVMPTTLVVRGSTAPPPA